MGPERSRPQRPQDAWRIWSMVLPIVLALGLLVVGFGVGTTCTNLPGNGGLDVAPCDRVDRGVKLNTAAQIVLFSVAAIHARRRNRHAFVTLGIVLISVAVAIAALLYATSY